jgi:hypothetical protein
MTTWDTAFALLALGLLFGLCMGLWVGWRIGFMAGESATYDEPEPEALRREGAL